MQVTFNFPSFNDKKITVAKVDYIDIALTLIFIFLTYPLFSMVRFLTPHSTGFPNNAGFFVFLLGYLELIIVLIFNRRRVFVWWNYLFLLSFNLYLITSFTNMWSVDQALQQFKYIRNAALLVYVLYALAHLIIHGMAWLLGQKRPVFTKKGLIITGVSVIILVFSFAISALIRDLVNIVIHAYSG
jgi:hypothetical protein